MSAPSPSPCNQAVPEAKSAACGGKLTTSGAAQAGLRVNPDYQIAWWPISGDACQRRPISSRREHRRLKNCIITLYTDEIAEYGRLGASNKDRYAMRHGYRAGIRVAAGYRIE